MDLSTMLARWKAGNLNERPTKALLGKLEKSYNAKVEKIQESRTMTPEMKRLELKEAGREFASDFARMRQEIIDGYEPEIENRRRVADPPRPAHLEEEMGRKTPIYLAKWQRSYGSMIRDAERFQQQGDRAGLELVKENLDLVENTGARSTLAEGVDQALDAYRTEEQRKAEAEIRSLGVERDKFEMASGVRQSGMVAAHAGRYRHSAHSWLSHDQPTAAPAEAAEPVGAGAGAEE